MAASCHPQGFGHGRVTLVGDAVHMGPPNGLGLNLALEDAAVLGHQLRVNGLTPQALRRWETTYAGSLLSVPGKFIALNIQLIVCGPSR
jgi:2-polyprenyl-6-methoxyphenol hydroxylase-like FAD-dependent oxidoreductase